MSYLDAVEAYYSGQRMVALAGVLAAVLFLLLGWKVYRRRNESGRTFGITTFLLAGLFMLPVNIGYLFYIGPQSEHVIASLSGSQSAFVAEELEHLGKMMDGFGRSYLLDTSAAILGSMVALVGLRFDRTKYVGTGLAVALCAVTLLSGEVWSKHRALHYQAIIRDARGRGE